MCGADLWYERPVRPRYKSKTYNCRMCGVNAQRRAHKNNPLKRMVGEAKRRAKVEGREFALCPEDLAMPEVCPVLGVPFVVSNGKQVDFSPSLDRFDNDGGYTAENVRVISLLANRIKNSATADQVRRVADWMADELVG